MRYQAFISYSHAADNKLAPAIEMGLRKFAKPIYQMHAMDVFRDTTSLSMTHQLWDMIAEAISESEYFILMASPSSAASEWVQKEITECTRLNRGLLGQLLIVLTDGEIVWNEKTGDFDWTETNALPLLLQGKFQKEPLFLDFRWTKERADELSMRNSLFLDGIATLSATIQSKNKADLIGEDVQSYRIYNRMRRTLNISLIVLLTVASFIVGFIYYQKERAEQRANLAELQKLEAQEDVKIGYSLNAEIEKMRNNPNESQYIFSQRMLYESKINQLNKKLLQCALDEKAK
jgi:hypothetical protein